MTPEIRELWCSTCTIIVGFENLMAQSVIALMVEKVRAFKGLIKGFGFTLNKPKREPRSQPEAKINKYTCQPALSPMDSSTFALTYTQRNKNTPQVISHLTVFSVRTTFIFTHRYVHSHRAETTYKPKCVIY